MSDSVLIKIEKKMHRFSKGQRNIATFILNHYDKAAYMTAAKLGVAAGVSESTVVRFAFELGYDGYPELQNDLQEIIKNKLTTLQRIELGNEQIGDGDVLHKVMSMDIEKIRRTMEDTSRESFNGAVNSIVAAKTIYIMGSGSAHTLAGFVSLYFNMIFDNVRLVQSTSMGDMFEQIMRIGKGDVIIGISFPRYSKKSVKAMKFAKDNGATAIAVTDSDMSPIAVEADIVLKAKNNMASFADSLVAPLSLMNALIAAVGIKRQVELGKTLERLENIWEEYDVYQKAEDN